MIEASVFTQEGCSKGELHGFGRLSGEMFVHRGTDMKLEEDL